MDADRYFEQSRQLFADQFEAEGDHYLYRRSLKGAPITVSAAERERYVATYDKSAKFASRFILWGAIALAAIFIGHNMVSSTLPKAYFLAGIILIIALSLVPTFWANHLPVRELRGRETVGEARSRAEVKALHLARLTYGELGLQVLAGVILLVGLSIKVDLLHGWNRLWLVFIALSFVFTAIRTFQKWRFDRR